MSLTAYQGETQSTLFPTAYVFLPSLTFLILPYPSQPRRGNQVQLDMGSAVSFHS